MHETCRVIQTLNVLFEQINSYIQIGETHAGHTTHYGYLSTELYPSYVHTTWQDHGDLHPKAYLVRSLNTALKDASPQALLQSMKMYYEISFSSSLQ